MLYNLQNSLCCAIHWLVDKFFITEFKALWKLLISIEVFHGVSGAATEVVMNRI